MTALRELPMTDMHREGFEKWWADTGEWLMSDRDGAEMTWQAAMRYRYEQGKRDGDV